MNIDLPVLLPDLLAEPERVAQVPLEMIPATIAQLSALIGQLSARQMQTPTVPRAAESIDQHDLLTVKQAAREFNVSRDWLYRNWKRYNLGTKVADNQVRISRKKFQRYLKMNQAV